MSVTLSPAQQKGYDLLLHALPLGSIFVLQGEVGHGKTTLLQNLHEHLGGALLTAQDFTTAMRPQHPLALEETFDQLVRHALAGNETVIVDDLNLITAVCQPCGMFTGYPRKNYLDAILNALVISAIQMNKKLIFGSTGSTPAPVQIRAFHSAAGDFEVADYAFFCHALMPAEIAEPLDYGRIFRFAPKLNAHQLKGACLWMRNETGVDTERFIAYLRSQKMASNVDLSEVQAVDIYSLKGVDDIIEALEAHIIMPLENDTLAAELDIHPKRGVLLYGPPGTGKTTVGRALAHRLKSKFFLIDGTIISGTQDFYEKIHQIFQAAKQNAPSIIFIDDSDVIFENGEEFGLYRYLLTMLDGLESESAGQVCVMMTAMNVASLPPALHRSGRVELWLETRLPDEPARIAILRDHVLKLPPVMGEIDVESLAAATNGLTGADIKRLIEDGKILYAFDRSRGLPLRPATYYFHDAIQTVRSNKHKYMEAEAAARQQNQSRPSYFNSMVSMEMAGAEADE